MPDADLQQIPVQRDTGLLRYKLADIVWVVSENRCQLFIVKVFRIVPVEVVQNRPGGVGRPSGRSLLHSFPVQLRQNNAHQTGQLKPAAAVRRGGIPFAGTYTLLCLVG